LTDIPVAFLIGALVVLILLSAFFSAAEIGMMTLNRHRLRHLAEKGSRAAKLTRRLLDRPDRLLGIILVGNNFANIAASFVTSLLTLELLGEKWLAAAAGVLTFTVLVFAEVAPKTFAALKPERVGLPAAFVLFPLLYLLYPAVWLVNLFGNWLLRLLGVSLKAKTEHEITSEELRALVREADVLIPETHQDMLIGILDLEKLTVEEAMLPRNQIDGIDLETPWAQIVAQITNSHHTRLVVYRGSLDNVVGIIHVRRVLNLMREGHFELEALQQILLEPYFIPEGTTLTTQLLSFKEVGRRLGLVVDEYGDIQGLITMDDILEEIVGDFTRRTTGALSTLQQEADGSYLVRGTMSLRDLNRQLDWNLPTAESRTLNGLVTEYLEDIPAPGTSLMLNDYLVEVLKTRGTAVELARIKRVTPTTGGESEATPSITNRS